MKFTPTETMVRAAENVFLAMAHLALIKPIVQGYQREILAKGQWTIRPEYATRLGQRVILDPKDSYLMPDEDFAIYDSQCKAARDSAKLFVINPEQCPLLVAESTVTQAQHVLIDSMSGISKLTVSSLLNSGMGNYKQYVELTLRLLAPFVKDSSEILAAIGINDPSDAAAALTQKVAN